LRRPDRRPLRRSVTPASWRRWRTRPGRVWKTRPRNKTRPRKRLRRRPGAACAGRTGCSTRPGRPGLTRRQLSQLDNQLHAARRAYKRARYAVEVIQPLWGRRARRLVRRIKELQDVLGEHQDCHRRRAGSA
jgi:CHAD domain-containing protein